MLKPLFALLLGVFATALSTTAQTAWTKQYEDNQLLVEYQYVDCHRPEDGVHKQEVHLRFTNKVGGELTVTYQKQLAYNNKPAATPGAENTFTVTLKPGEVLEGSCSLKDKRLYIFAKMLDGTSQSVLTAFDLVNIQVK